MEKEPVLFGGTLTMRLKKKNIADFSYVPMVNKMRKESIACFAFHPENILL